MLPDAAVVPVEAPTQLDEPLCAELLHATPLIRASEARRAFKVDGGGTAVAVLDTGLRASHVDFRNRVRAQRNFTSDNGGDPGDAADGHGHGTSVAGIVAAGEIHVGMAPGAHIVPLKVLSNGGTGRFGSVADALQWVIDHRAAHGISAVCLSFGDGGNHRSDAPFADDAIGRRIAELTQARVACCAAAGNAYHAHDSAQGMAYPAILRDALSVGAVYDSAQGPFRYRGGARASDARPDQITPFSQRLHAKVGGGCATDIFAPGVPVPSSGILNDVGESIQQGLSQATPVVAGIVLLLQSYHKRATGGLPPVADLRRWLRLGAVPIHDIDGQRDNVLHTGLTFHRVDALAALQACAKDLARKLIAHGVDTAATRFDVRAFRRDRR